MSETTTLDKMGETHKECARNSAWQAKKIYELEQEIKQLKKINK